MCSVATLAASICELNGRVFARSAAKPFARTVALPSTLPLQLAAWPSVGASRTNTARRYNRTLLHHRALLSAGSLLTPSPRTARQTASVHAAYTPPYGASADRRPPSHSSLSHPHL